MKHIPAILCAFFFLMPNQVNQKLEFRKYSARQFYKNINIIGGEFSNDGQKILFTSDKTGIYNAYTVSVTTGEIEQVTDSKKESIYAYTYVPGSDAFIYGADQGGNELTHIYLKKPGADAIDLTPDSNQKVQFTGWSLDKKSMYYQSNKRDPRYFDIYKMNIADWKPQKLYTNDSGYAINAISNNEHYLLVSKSITTSVTELYLVDLKTNGIKKLSKEGAHASYYGLRFSNNDKKIYYLTDEGSEFQHVIEYDVTTGKGKNYFSTDWDVMYLYFTDNEKYRVIGINKDGKNVIRVFNNLTNEEVAFPDINDGDISAVAFPPAENKIRLSVESSVSPKNLYVYDLGSKKLKKLTNTLNSEINEKDLAKAEVVRFKSFDGIEIPAIYYKPLNASATNKVPAVLWIHGGPGGQSRIGFVPSIQFLVNHGYAVLAVNNRGSSGYGKTFFAMDDRDHGGADLKDCIYGKKYLQTLDYINPDEIGILGGSYGGFMTLAALCFYPDAFNCGVDYFGVANWLRTLKSIPPYWASFRTALYAEMGDPFTADSVRLRNISPLFNADKITKPLMVLQGVNDPRVLKAESDEIVAAVKKNSVPVEYVVFPDEGHGFVKTENKIMADSSMLVFLNKYLKK